MPAALCHHRPRRRGLPRRPGQGHDRGPEHHRHRGEGRAPGHPRRRAHHGGRCRLPPLGSPRRAPRRTGGDPRSHRGPHRHRRGQVVGGVGGEVPLWSRPTRSPARSCRSAATWPTPTHGLAPRAGVRRELRARFRQVGRRAGRPGGRLDGRAAVHPLRRAGGLGHQGAGGVVCTCPPGTPRAGDCVAPDRVEAVLEGRASGGLRIAGRRPVRQCAAGHVGCALIDMRALHKEEHWSGTR